MNNSRFDFNIYVYGMNAQTTDMIRWFADACAQLLPHQHFQIDVVDIAISPEHAETNKILATPTILRLSPQPFKRVVGRMDQTQAAQAVHLLTEL